ncbi:MAG: glycoside hydrolase family 25 protein [Lachnospiraceae bacterium]|nr:glycoside hydrolase family 25 protein [Lachnospiraceae bacterium]MBP5276130.1 glycoside hydrolase family 25 protein [Lachnospiraceae bacterium]
MSKKNLYLSVIAASMCLLLVLAVVFAANIKTDKKKQNSTTGESTPVTEYAQKTKEVYTDSKSFLNDKNFLDEYQPNAEKKEEVKKKEAKLVVGSVAKDIRVTIVDSIGNKISGVPFYVNIEDVGEYKDLDMDGYIYIAGIKPGTYEVSLQETEKFVCKENVEIEVNETVQYAALEDIRYAIVQEKDINVEAEDIQLNDVDKDSTENTKIKKSNDKISFGIDVSAWQKEIDWEKVKAAGVDFVIIRCGYRGAKTGVLVEDSYFYKNLQGAKDAGIDVGVYFFTQALNETEAVEEASMVLALVGDTELDYPIFIDTENTNGRADPLDKNTRTAVCDAFCKTIERAGKKAGVYASRNWFNTKLDDDKLESHVRWVAEYASTTAYAKRYEMWQYTSSGSIDGINGRVDLDVSYIGN